MATNHTIPTNKGYCPRGLGSSPQNCIGWFDSAIALSPLAMMENAYGSKVQVFLLGMR